MQFIRQLLGGMMSVLALGPSPLYRYPYRNEAEGLSGDIQKVGKDIASMHNWDGTHHE